MSELDHIGKHPLTLHWRVTKQLLFLWETDLDAMAPLVPASLECVEVRPGRGLVALEVLRYATGHFRPDYREFLEIVFTAAVQPDLSIDMPVPRYCMYAISVYSDSPEFCDQEHRLLHTPTELIPNLRCEFSDDDTRCDVFDGDQPIAHIRNTNAQLGAYERKTMYGQYYTNTQGLEHGLWRWDGHVSEHMKPGDWGSFHPHRFWKGLDLGRVRSCYRQMLKQPGTESSVRFYHRGPVASAR
jgi:hypothetical protein